jgi:TonB family protein
MTSNYRRPAGWARRAGPALLAIAAGAGANEHFAPVPGLDEALPPIARDEMLAEPQIRFCLAQIIRIEAIRPLLDRTQPAQVAYFNETVADYNGRCGRYRYEGDALASARYDVEAVRPKIEDAARAALRQRFPPQEPAQDQVAPSPSAPPPAQHAAVDRAAASPRPPSERHGQAPPAPTGPASPPPDSAQRVPVPAPPAAIREEGERPKPAPESATAAPLAPPARDPAVPATTALATPESAAAAPVTVPPAAVAPAAVPPPAVTAAPATERPSAAAAAAVAEPPPAAAAEAPATSTERGRAAKGDAKVDAKRGAAAKAKRGSPSAAKPAPPAKRATERSELAAVAAPAPVTEPESPLERFSKAIRRDPSLVVDEAYYPAAAQGLGWEGSAYVDVRFAAEGFLRSINLAQSSGHEALDADAVRIVRDLNFPDVPADLRGVEFTIRVPVVFRASRRAR